MNPNDTAVAISTVGYHELFTFFAMVVAFCAGAFFLKLPIGVALVIGSLVGVAVGGHIFPLPDLIRHLVEGMFAYLDPILIIASATIFMYIIERNGLLGALANWLVRSFASIPILLLAAVTFAIMFPGMLTGSSTAAVLTTGALMAPVLRCLGIPRAQTGAIIALAALYGMTAPPVNIPALIIGAGIDLPYVGMDLPLLVLSVPLALCATWYLGLPHCKKVSPEEIKSHLKTPADGKNYPFLFLPLVVLVILLLGERFYPEFVMLGLPMIFLLSAAVGLFTGAPVKFLTVSREAMAAAMPILGILMGVGMFIQVMTLTGARGEVVIQALRLPRGWDGLYPIIGLSMPLFGAVSSFGAASVLGVPFVLALPTGSEVIVMNTASITLIVALGDLMPPTALAGLFAAQVVGEKNYLNILKHCVVPAIVTVIVGLLAIQYAAFLAPRLVFFGG